MNVSTAVMSDPAQMGTRPPERILMAMAEPTTSCNRCNKQRGGEREVRNGEGRQSSPQLGKGKCCQTNTALIPARHWQ